MRSWDRDKPLSLQCFVMSRDWRFRKNMRLRGFDYAARRCYFVTIVALNRRPFFRNTSLADATIDVLLNLRQNYRFNLYQYCLMPDHFHGLFGAGESGKDLGEICGAFKSLSNSELWRFEDGKLWQKRFFDHIIRNEQDFWETVDYIRNNAVRKGLVKDWREWKWTGGPDLPDELM